MVDSKDWVILILGGPIGVLSSLIAALLIGPVLETIATYKVICILSFLFTRFQDKTFEEPWNQIWEVRSSHFARSNTSPIVFRKFAQFLTADTYNKTLNGQIIHWRLVAKISRKTFVTGTWYDLNRSGYHGAFQMSLAPHMESATGIWIGFATNGSVKSGRLIWVRKGHSIPTETYTREAHHRAEMSKFNAVQNL